MEIDLLGSDRIEELYNIYVILGQYLALEKHLLAQQGQKKRKLVSSYEGYEGVDYGSEMPLTKKARGPKNPMSVTTPAGISHKSERDAEDERIRLEMERFFKATDAGPDPFMFEYDQTLFKATLPGFELDPEKFDLAQQYAYIDQLLMELNLHSQMNSGGNKSLLFAAMNKREFMKKMQSESSSRSEFHRLVSLLPEEMRLQVASETEDFSKYFVREGVSVSKPYITERMRQKVLKAKDPKESETQFSERTKRFLSDGDVIHIPFSDLEKEIALRSDRARKDPNSVVPMLPGRTALDVQRFFEDQDALHGQPPTRSIQKPLIWTQAKSAHGPDSLFGAIDDRPMRLKYSYPRDTRGIAAKSLLSNMVENGLSTVTKEAIVDVNTDPTGLTSRVIVGTAKNETMNALNVSVLYDLEKGTYRVLNEHTDTVASSDFSIDGRRIITASYDKSIIVRDADTCKIERFLGNNRPDGYTGPFSFPSGQIVEKIGHDKQILDVVLHKRRVDTAVSFDPNRMLLWNLDSGELRVDLTKDSPIGGYIMDMCFAEGVRYSDLLIVGSESPSKKGEIRLFDTVTSTLMNVVAESRGCITAVETNTDSLVLASTKSMVRMYDIRDPTVTVSMFKTMQKDVNSVSFSPCERYIQSSATDNRCVVFDVRIPERPLHVLAHLHPSVVHLENTGLVGINSAIWTQDGDCIVTGGEDGFVRVWDIKRGDPLIKAYKSNSPICACQVSPSYDFIVAGTEGGTVHLWTLENSNYVMDDEKVLDVSEHRTFQGPAQATAPTETDSEANRLAAEAWINANIEFLARQLDEANNPEPITATISSVPQGGGVNNDDAMDIDEPQNSMGISKVDQDDDEDEDEESDAESSSESDEDSDEDDSQSNNDNDNDNEDDPNRGQVAQVRDNSSDEDDEEEESS